MSTTPAPRLRVAVVGLGAIGQEHVAVCHAHPLVELTAVVDPREDARAAVTADTGAQSFATLARALAADVVVVDAVILCTPDHLHYDDACTVLAAGKHLLLEKPITTDPTQADDLVLRAERSDLVVMPGHTLRFEPRYHHARTLVQSGALGGLQHGYLRRDNTTAVADRAAGRVSVGFFLGIHDIDALQWITGEQVVQVQAMATSSTERTGQQAAALLCSLRLSGGAVVQLESAWNLPPGYPTELDAALRLVGSRTTVSVHSFDAGLHLAGNGYTLPMTAGSTMYGTAQGPLALEVATFVRCCLDGTAPPITVREAAAAVKVVVALEQAVKTGETVDVAPVVTGATR